jgi:hypothetical protein
MEKKEIRGEIRKKYMLAENIEILKEFGISQFVATVNNRCDRFICTKCMKVSEFHSCDSGCEYEENTIKVSKYIDTGVNEIFLDQANIKVEEINSVMSVYYWSIQCFVDMDEGILRFEKKPIILMQLKNGTFNAMHCREFNGVSLKAIKEAIENAGIECPDLIDNIKKVNLIGHDSYQQFSKYCQLVKEGHTLFADVNFISTHKKLIRHVMNRSYLTYKINSKKGISDAYEVPMCLVDYMNDDYFDLLVGYHDIRMLDKHPVEIQGCIGYYVSVGKFKKGTIKQYLNTFEPSDFDTKEKISCFINFVKKNLWMGDSLFDYAEKAFNCAETAGMPINEETINSKFMFSMKNMNLLYERFGHGISDAFMHVKDTQGIVPAMKYLLESLEEEKKESAK